ncbi:MAG: Hpt domain-containing protein [Elusimicrobia bacterium]|nr:Hpt domain-containing protein [Elusimicrobiota bacterium]
MSEQTEKIIIKINKELQELIPKFLQNRKKDIENLQDALNKNDFEAIRIMGHTLQGVGGGYGFYQITALGEKISKAAKTKDIKSIENLISEFIDFMNNIRVEYE